MTTIFCSDIHGNYQELKSKINKMMEKYPQAEIVLGGDYIDGWGSIDIFNTLKYIFKLQKEKDAKVLIGNHEDMFLNFCKFDDLLWFQNGAKKTIKSLFGRGYSKEVAKYRLSQLKLDRNTYLIDWLKSLPVDYENKDGYFVHAYINPNLDLKTSKEKTSFEDKIWNRQLINCEKNLTGKSIIVGHTPIQIIDKNMKLKPIIKSEKYYPIYFCDGGSKGAFDNSELLVCVFEKGELIEYC